MQDYIISIGRAFDSGGRRIAKFLEEGSKQMRHNSDRSKRL